MFHFVDNKKGVVLEAALAVFITYGFRKTSMDDIAKQAGVSRPALYQLFRNKKDIFRALVAELMDGALERAREAFKRPGTIRDQLFRALDSSIMELHRFCDQSPHARELMSIDQEIARDLEATWKKQMIETLAKGIDQGAADNNIDMRSQLARNLDSRAIARIIMHSMEGMRETYLSGESIDPYLDQLVDFVAGAIEPSQG